MLSALLMWRRFRRVLVVARQEQEFIPVLTAGATVVAIGTVTYAVGNGWGPIDAFPYAVATLTTTSVADPDLVLEDAWMKLFTVFYLMVGIGVLVETLRRFGLAFVEVQREERAAAAEGAEPAR